jgi:hypothetical protein
MSLRILEHFIVVEKLNWKTLDFLLDILSQFVEMSKYSIDINLQIEKRIKKAESPEFVNHYSLSRQ